MRVWIVAVFGLFGSCNAAFAGLMFSTWNQGVSTGCGLSAWTSSVDTATISLPSGIVAGDLIILIDRAEGDAGPPMTVVPSGFSVLTNQMWPAAASGRVRQITSYKLALGTEGGSTITGMLGAMENVKLVSVFNVSATSATPGGLQTAMNGADLAAQTIGSSVAGGRTLAFAAYGTLCTTVGCTIDPLHMTPAKDGFSANWLGAGGDNKVALAWKSFNAGSATDVSVDIDDEGDRNALQSGFIELGGVGCP